MGVSDLLDSDSYNDSRDDGAIEMPVACDAAMRGEGKETFPQ